MTEKAVKIRSITALDPSKIEPILVSFANGYHSHNSKIIGTLHKYNSEIMPNRRMAMFCDENTSYVGRNFGLETPDLEESLFLGIHDPHSGKMKLTEVTYMTAYPYLDSTETRNLFLKKPEDSYTFLDKQEHIAIDFGTKKSKAMVDRKKRYQVNLEDMSSAISEAVLGADVDDDVLEEPESILDCVPPCNRKAKYIEDVYQLNSVVPEKELNLLFFEANNVMTIDINNSKSPIFQFTLNSLNLSKKDSTKLSAALYMEELVQFIAKNRVGKSVNNLPFSNGPKLLSKNIMKYFTQGNRRVLLEKLQDKALCYILVLGFLLNNFNLPCDLVMKSLGINRKKLFRIAKATGAKPSTNGLLIQLKLPLAIYTNEMSKKKRKLK